MSLDSQRYLLADLLYAAEGRWGILEGEVRHLPDLDEDGALAAWAEKFAEVERCGHEALWEGQDVDKAAGWVDAIRLVRQLRADLAAVMRAPRTEPCPPSSECIEHGRAA